MPRVYTHKARKDYPKFGIVKGDTYYEWSNRMGRMSITRKSKTYPRRSQLTMSDFLGQVYDIFDVSIPEAQDADALREIASDLTSLGEEQSEKRSGMPDNLQDAPTGEMLQTRADSCEEAAQEIEQAADELEEKLSTIQEREDKWADYESQLIEWDGGDNANIPDEPENPEEGEPEDEPDWAALREEALTEAREAISEPDWG